MERVDSQRKEDRYRGVAKVLIGQGSGDVIDLSTSGVSFLWSHDWKLNLGQSVDFTLFVAESDVFEAKLEMSLTGIIKGCRYVEHKGLYRIGLECHVEEDQKKAMIEHLVSFLEDRDSFWGIE